MSDLDLACPTCNSSEWVQFDYSAVVMVEFRKGKLQLVQAGGVFGGLPDHFCCMSCGTEGAVPEMTADAVTSAVLEQSDLDDDGWTLLDQRDLTQTQVLRHPAQDDLLAVARAVGVTTD